MSATLSEGSLIDDQYRIEKLLGAGASGEVYLANDLALERAVALKVLRKHLLTMADNDAKRRFEREARVLSGLMHPNIVQVYRLAYLDQKVPFLAMEYVEGESARQLIMRRQKLSCHETVLLIKQLVSALSYAHGAGVTHRDLKPENLLLSQDGDNLRLKLSDFGLCKLQEAANPGNTLTQTGALIGTPLYMSPEQLMGKAVDFRSDIYALGIIFFELISGEHPLAADLPQDILFKHLNQPLPDLLKLSPESAFPELLQSIMEKCCRKDPESRYKDFDSLSADLNELEKLNCHKTFVGASVHLNDHGRRHPAAKTPVLAAGFCIALGLLTLIAFYLLGQQSKNLAPADAIASDLRLFKAAVSGDDHASAGKLLKTCVGSSQYKSWSFADRAFFLDQLAGVCAEKQLNSELLFLQVKQIEELLLAVGKELARGQQVVFDPQQERIAVDLSKKLALSEHTSAQWREISRMLESKWTLPMGGQSAQNLKSNTAWLWILRLKALKQAGSPPEDASTLAKYYIYTSEISQALCPEMFEPLTKECIEICRKYGANHRLVELHVQLGRLALNKGRRQEAQAQLLLAKSMLAETDLSEGQKEILKNLEDQLNLPAGVELKQDQSTPKERGLQDFYKGVLDLGK